MTNLPPQANEASAHVTDQAELVSVVLPAYNEGDNLAPLIREIARALESMTYEIVAVDDGSSDNSIEVLRDLSSQFEQLRIIALPHRVGQSAALMAGLDAARGATVVTLDADGQNDPDDIPRLLNLLRGSQDPVAVTGVRSTRAAGRWKRIQARVATLVRNAVTGDRVQDTGCALRVVRRADLMRLPRFRSMHRFIPTLLRREGIAVLEVPVRDRPRRFGVSKYGMWNRMAIGLIDALGVRWLIRRKLGNHGLPEKDP